MSRSILPPGFGGMIVRRSWHVAPNTAFIGDGALMVHPWMDLARNEYRPPFYTRMCVGVQEIERMRRRRAKGLPA